MWDCVLANSLNTISSVFWNLSHCNRDLEPFSNVFQSVDLCDPMSCVSHDSEGAVFLRTSLRIEHCWEEEGAWKHQWSFMCGLEGNYFALWLPRNLSKASVQRNPLRSDWWAPHLETVCLLVTFACWKTNILKKSQQIIIINLYNSSFVYLFLLCWICLAALAYFSSCGEWGPLSSCCVCGLLTVVACLADPGPWAWWLRHMGSVVVPPGL